MINATGDFIGFVHEITFKSRIEFGSKYLRDDDAPSPFKACTVAMQPPLALSDQFVEGVRALNLTKKV